MRPLIVSLLVGSIVLAACERKPAKAPHEKSAAEDATHVQGRVVAKDTPDAASRPQPAPTHRLEIEGRFGPDVSNAEALNARTHEIVGQVLERHGVRAKPQADPALPLIRIVLGAGEGASFRIEVQPGGDGEIRQRSYAVPKGAVPAETVTNFDHTLDRALREMELSRHAPD